MMLLAATRHVRSTSSRPQAGICNMDHRSMRWPVERERKGRDARPGDADVVSNVLTQKRGPGVELRGPDSAIRRHGVNAAATI